MVTCQESIGLTAANTPLPLICLSVTEQNSADDICHLLWAKCVTVVVDFIKRNGLVQISQQ